MIRRQAPLCLFILLLTPVAFGILACGQDLPTLSPAPAVDSSITGSVEGSVRLLPENTPLAGVELVLLDASVMGVAAGPVRSDESGAFRFERVPEGRFYPVPLMDEELQLDRDVDAVEVRRDEVAHLELRVIRSEYDNQPTLKMSGVVRDAETNEPLAGTLVSPGLGDPRRYFYGATLPSEDFTDELGSFELLQVPVSNRTGTTLTIVATRPGYRPHAFRAPAPLAGEPDSVHVDIRLIRGEGDATLMGRVVQDGVPMAGVSVILDYYSEDPELLKGAEKALLLGFATLTDHDGWYRFEGLSQGSYTIAPGSLPDDGIYFYLYLNLQARVDLKAGEMITVPDLELGTVIEPLSPLPQSTVVDAFPEFRWAPVPGADRYNISFAVGHIFGVPVEVRSPSFRPTVPLLDGSTVRWHVYAFDQNRVLGGFDQVHTFEVDLSAPKEN